MQSLTWEWKEEGNGWPIAFTHRTSFWSKLSPLRQVSHTPKIYKEGHRWKEFEQLQNSHVSIVKTAGRPSGETCHTMNSHGPLPSKCSISLLWQQTHHAGQITNTSAETTENNQLLKKTARNITLTCSYSSLSFFFFYSA